MRYLILSDIHANWEALTAVLAHAEGSYDRILNCGDLVGYGADPNRVTEWCRKHCQEVIRGNHDKACAGLADMMWFNPVARLAAEWTASQLNAENLKYIRELTQGPMVIDGAFQIMHGSPVDEDEYLIDTMDVAGVLGSLDWNLSFFGHTHVQGAFLIQRNKVHPFSKQSIELEEHAAYLVNPGSVGQPRDHDWRAAYAIYDSDDRTIQLARTEYDVAATKAKIIAAGLPEILAFRLDSGR